MTRIECEIVADTTSILEDCNECPKCGSLNNERINKAKTIEMNGLEGICKNEQQKNYFLAQMLNFYNKTCDKKYKCNNCSHEYEVKYYQSHNYIKINKYK